MAEYKDMIITNKGKELINRQIIGEKNFEITKIVVGTGNHEDTEDLKECEDLKSPLKDYEIYSMERKDGAVEIKSVVTNISYEQEALLHEVGVYASDGEDEVLYAIATAVYPLQIPAYNGEFEYKIDFVMHFTIDSGVGVILRDRTDIATKKAAGAVKASEDIKVEADGTMRIADYESNDSDDIADVPGYQVNLTEPPIVGKGRIPLGWKETTAIKKGEKLPSIIGKLTNIAYNVKWLFKWLNSINTVGEYTSVDSQGNIVRVKNSASDAETGVPFPFPIQTVVEGHELALRQLNTDTKFALKTCNKIQGLRFISFEATADAAGNAYINPAVADPVISLILAAATNTDNTVLKTFCNNAGMWYINVTRASDGTPYPGKFGFFMLII